MEFSNKTVVIYGLATPEGVVRYVGKAENPHQRYNKHIADAGSAVNTVKKTGGKFIIPSPKEYWISSLRYAGEHPRLVYLEVCWAHEAKKREDEWIRHYVQAGHYLTNTVTPKGCPSINKDWYSYWRRHRAKTLGWTRRKKSWARAI